MIIVVALLLEASILKYVNDRNAHRTSKVLLDRVITVLDKNDESRNELIESLKDDYIVRAKAVSYMIDADPAVEYDVDELQKIAKLMAVDEIHLFDDQGTIYSGSAPKYFGYNFDSGTQMEYFKPMLKDKSLTMCQDVTPNTAEGKKMMYAITWNNKNYKDYSTAYFDIMEDYQKVLAAEKDGQKYEGPWQESWTIFVRNGEESTYVSNAQFQENLKRRKDYFRRYRDLSIIITVGVYAISIIDAYVDAQLFDFDISPDLSLHWSPEVTPKTRYTPGSYGLNCSFKF